MVGMSIPAMASGIPSAAIPGRESGFTAKLPDVVPIPQQEEEGGPSTTGAQSDIPEFLLKDISLDGNTVFSREDLLSIINSKIGTRVTLQELKDIADQITRKYRQNGYLLCKAFIPEQSAENGIIKIQIVEGYVSEVSTQGEDSAVLERRDAMKIIAGFKDMVTSMRPFNIDTMQKQLLVMNDAGMVDASVTFVPLDKKTASVGAVGLQLNLKKRPVTGDIGMNNYASRYVGPYHMEGNIRTGSLLTSWDQLDIFADTSLPFGKVFSISPNYSFPVLDGGGRGYGGLTYSNSAPEYTLSQLDVKGSARKAKLGYSYPLVRSRQGFLEMNLEFQVNNSDVDTLGITLYKDRIRKFTGTVRGVKFDSFQGLNEASLSVSQGLNILGAKGEGSADISRSDGQSDFTTVNISYARTQSLPRSMEAYAGINGQYSAVPLLASEEFGFGGANTGRAFDPSEVTGDKGASALLELRYKGLSPRYGIKATPFAYFDFGKLWNYNAAEGSVFVSSAGIGMKIASDYRINGDIMLAFPLAGEQGAPRWGNGSSPRLLLKVSRQF